MAAALEKARTTSVLFVGETIIDEYQYCESIGKSGKEPVLAVRYVSEEKFAGGVLATANQSAAFCDRIGMLTLLGTKDSHEEFIREKLNPKIDTSFLYMAGARTILKRRMVETYPFQKLFEVYFMDQEVPEAVNQALYARLQALLPHYDAVVVTDYGHGMLTPEIIELLCGSDRFLAVNTQTNAANQGFNSPSKYARADFLCLSEKELRLEVRNRTKDLRLIVAETAERLVVPADAGHARAERQPVLPRQGRVLRDPVVHDADRRSHRGRRRPAGRDLALRRQGRADGSHRLHRQRRGRPGRRDRGQSQRRHAGGPGKTNQRLDELRSLDFDAVGWDQIASESAHQRGNWSGTRTRSAHPTVHNNEDNVQENRGRVFVPGGAGYVGAVLVPRLLELGYGVHVLDLYIYGEQALAAVKDHPRSATVPGRRSRPGGGPRGRRGLRQGRSTWPASPTTPAWNSTPISATR